MESLVMVNEHTTVGLYLCLQLVEYTKSKGVHFALHLFSVMPDLGPA